MAAEAISRMVDPRSEDGDYLSKLNHEITLEQRRTTAAKEEAAALRRALVAVRRRVSLINYKGGLGRTL